jgi:uncharacterized protein (UPF0218 family)
MIDHRGRYAARRRKLQKTIGKLCEGRRLKGDCWWKNRVRVGDDVVAAQAAIGFGRILHRLQVVGDRNHREKDQDEHSKGDKLSTPVGTSVPGVPQPEAEK